MCENIKTTDTIFENKTRRGILGINHSDITQ